MLSRLILVMILVAIINMIETLAYGARLAGVRTRSPSVAMSLFNVVALGARTANLIQLPLVASIVDIFLKTGEKSLLSFFRLILLANSAGVLLGIFFIPLSVKAFTWGIGKMNETHSVPRVFMEFLRPRNLKKAVSFPVAGLSHLRTLKISDLPFTFLILNPVLAAFYSVGVLSAIYAGFLLPEYRLTASQLSGIVNGVATILLVILVDPISAMIVDDTIKGQRKEKDLKSAIAFLAGGRFMGSLLAQLLLIPAAYLIILITWLLV